ncbi:endonuclease/exonuclease/phosphatase family protein [Luteolibacter arcticus]|uniref:Endonuclease/exonuclease/phosphatase family protein n=1 Tax=Luteolibacter arcticus TaxID=1581411 RepID=A0ABT3GIE2_9BACT|nr:endonuclease/exonuclease/phosphatase family protein [Luteolibacter arcticus]MCW1923259.1 endonuclease/exonuclease/phosphatase family protein [Luteolibacter arcticus]
MADAIKWRTRLLPKPLPFIARLAALAGCFPILGFFGGIHWKMDLFNHFQVQYAVFIALAVIVLLAVKSFRLAAFAAVFLVVPAVRLAPCFFGTAGKPIGTPLRVATFNVLTSNMRYDDAVKWVQNTDPDVVFLPEVDAVWAEALRPLLASHPHSIDHLVEGNFGFALYSKLPIVSREIIPCGQMELPLLKVRLSGPKEEFIFYGAHPVPPTTEFWSNERNAFLHTLADQVSKETLPVIATGDFNATRWSHGMKPLWNAGLLDSANGHGAGSTWMRGSLLFAVPIDHVLFRAPGAVCTKRWIGPDLGSDHRAVVAEIAW